MIEKEHAIRILEAMRTNWDEDSKCPNAHALDLAIKSLKSKTYEDAINELIYDKASISCVILKLHIHQKSMEL